MAKSPSLDAGLGQVKERLVPPLGVFTLSLQEKGFLEGTTLPPTMIYLGPAGLSKKKKKHTFKRLEKHPFLHTALGSCMHIDFEPAMY